MFDMLNRVKSSAELEEEMLAKIPKFKALPLPKKVILSKILSCFQVFIKPSFMNGEFSHIHTKSESFATLCRRFGLVVPSETAFPTC